MHYISTRGEAPPLSFADALMAGLARDGGLYVPEEWPTLSQQEIAALAGRSYADVARAVITPFVGDAIPKAALDVMIDDAYACFRHGATTPMVQIAPNRFVLELFHGPTLAFKDVAMQLLARLMDHVLSRRGARATLVGATSGDTGSAAIEAFRHSDALDVFILFPHNRVSEVQRRQMTTVGGHNVHAIAVEGTFDDCQAHVKAMFNNHVFRDRMALAGVNSINWARIVAQVVYYFYSAAALGAPARDVSFVVPTGNFGDIFAGWVAKKMGLPVRDLTIATNVNDILSRTIETGRYEVKGVHATISPSMDIQVSSNFERLLFESVDRDAHAVRDMMASLTQSGSFTIPRDAFAAILGEFSAGRADEPETSATITRVWRESGYVLDPHTAVALTVAAKVEHSARIPQIVLSTAHPAKFPDAVEAATGKRPALPPHMADLMTRKERMTILPNDIGAIERFISTHSRITAGAAAVSVRETRLDNGITVVTDAMPHLGTASLGIWVGAGARDEAESEHGISHLLEHMAFKGTRRRSARRIAEEIEQVGGDINAATSVEQTSYNVRVLGEDVGLGLDILADILTEPAFAPDELVREQNVIVQEIGAVMDTPDDLVFDLFQETAFPRQPVGRSILGTPETVRGFDSARLGAYLGRTYRGPRMVVSAAGAVDHDRLVADAQARLGVIGAGAKAEPVGARYEGGTTLTPRDLEQVHVVLGIEGRSFRSPDFHAVQVLANVLGGGMSSRLFQEVREERGLCYSIYAFHWAYADTGLFGIYAGTDDADVGELTSVVIDQLKDTAETVTEIEVARAKAQMKVGLLAALESSGARADQLARQILGFDRIISVEEIVAKLEAVDVAAVRAATRDLLAQGRPTLSAIGPGKGLEPAVRVMERLKVA